MKTTFFESLFIHDSWSAFFQIDAIQRRLFHIENHIGKEYTPEPSKVLRFAELDLNKIKVLIIGKDPYPQKGKATGRAFEVEGAESWFDRDINYSLKNIIKAIHKAYNGMDRGASIEAVRKDIKENRFPIPNPNQAFDYWEKQGVLFLNSAFTCEIGGIDKSGSHINLWKPFFYCLLDYITTNNKNIKYFLWGYARKYEELLSDFGVKQENLYPSRHPSSNGDQGSYKKNSFFLNNPCFVETKSFINWI